MPPLSLSRAGSLRVARGDRLRLASRHDGLGTEHLRFGVFYRGLPVVGSEASLHVDVSLPARPAIIYVACSLAYPSAGGDSGDEPLSVVPRLAASDALQRAEAAVDPGAVLRGESSAHLAVVPLPSPGRLVYQVRVDSLRPRGLFQMRLDALDGRLISARDLLRYAPLGPKDGKGRVFVANPIVSQRDPTLRDKDDAADAVPAAAYTDVVLRDLDGDGGLTGPYVTTAPTPGAVRRVRLEFPFLRDHDGFEEVMAYYHIDAAQRFIQSLGFTNVYNRRISVYANSEPPGVPYVENQAYYLPDPQNPGTGVIAFGSGGVDFAEDPEVILHEYGHATQDSQVPGFGNEFGASEARAIGEGWADWLAAAYLFAYSEGFGDLCLGEWVATENPFGEEPANGEICVRRLDSTKKYPDDLEGEPHADGEIWSAALWKVFEELGRLDSLRLVFQSNFYLGTTPSFADAANAVLKADRQLFEGAHEDFLRQVFRERGLFAEPLDLRWFYVRKQSTPLPAEGDPVLSTLKISRAGSIASAPRHPVRVYVNLIHTFPSGVGISLRSPSGTTVRLSGGRFGFIAPGPMVFGVTVQPEESLESLAGEPSSGVWTLVVENDFFEDGTLSEWGLGFAGFVRGDANGDLKLDLSDAISLLQYLFLRGEMPCLKAGDFNDDGALSITDAIASIRFSFHGGAAPPEPYPQAGEELTPDRLGCEQ